MALIDILQTEDVKAVLCEFAGGYRAGMTADQLLRYAPYHASLGARAGNSVGKKLGIRSLARRSFELPQGLTLSGVSLLCALFAQGITVEAVEESPTRDALLLRGTVPSSIFHYGGEISVNVTGSWARSTAEITIIYPGQIFVWGSGGRLIAKLRHHCDRALARLQSCPSLRIL